MKKLNNNEIKNIAGGLDAPKYDCRIISKGLLNGGRIVFDLKISPKEIDIATPEEAEVGKNIVELVDKHFAVDGYEFICKMDTKTYE